MLDMFGNTNCTHAIKKIQKIPLAGYTGNKKRILDFIWHVLEEEDVEFNSFLDLFSGSAVVSLFMKEMGKKVISNDFLTTSYYNSLNFVENTGYALSHDECMFIVENSPDYNIEEQFVYKNYLNKRFTKKECINLDKILFNLYKINNPYKFAMGFNNLKNAIIKTPFGMIDRATDLYKHRLKQLEKYGKGTENHDRRIGLYYDDDLNIDFERWFIKYNKSFNKSLFYEINNKNDVKNVNQDNFPYNIDQNDYIALNKEVFDLLNYDFHSDLIYIDPPYGGNSSDYVYLYQFLEEYLHSDFIDNIEYLKEGRKKFVSKYKYEENFRELLNKCSKYPAWLISYNNSAWQDINYIADIINEYKEYVKIYSYNNYTYNYRDKKNNLGTEYIVFAK